MRLDDSLSQIAAKYCDKTALAMCGGPSITFGELWSRIDSLAAGLVTAGVLPGDRVAIISRQSIDAVVLFWGILRARGVVVWLNDDARADDFPQFIENADPLFVFVQTDRHRALVEGACQGATSILDLSDALRLEIDADGVVLPNASVDDPAAIIYTSGSSGWPKGVCLTHRNLSTVVGSVIQHMPISHMDSYLMVVPLHYVHGIMQLLVHGIAGATVYFYDNFVFPRMVVRAIQSTGVTGFSGVPFHFNALISRGGLLDADLPKLKWLTVTGGKLASQTIFSLLDHFPEVNFHIAYGQTECAPRATALDPTKVRDKVDSVGSAIPGVSVLLLDDAGVEVSKGAVGEVVVDGANVMQGYWRDKAATDAAIDGNGRLHTGDLGRFDPDGDLFLVGRKSAMIKSAGERIVPEEIERVLIAHLHIEDAVVVGVTDEMYGQRVVAHILTTDESVEVDDSSFIADVREYCLRSISSARAPREYRRWHKFPRKANGKPDRSKIASAESNP